MPFEKICSGTAPEQETAFGRGIHDQIVNNKKKKHMKAYSTSNIRNVVLLGSTKSGKTTLSEAMLYEGKVIERRGSVEAKNTVSDNTEIEQMNQRSIYSTPLYAEFMDTKFNIIDTPGADDFIGGAVSAFKVCDTGPRSSPVMPASTMCR